MHQRVLNAAVDGLDSIFTALGVRATILKGLPRLAHVELCLMMLFMETECLGVLIDTVEMRCFWLSNFHGSIKVEMKRIECS